MQDLPAMPTATFQTRIDDHPAFAEMAKTLSKVEHNLFHEMARGRTPGQCKNEFLKRFSISARQFNSIAIALKGKVASIRELDKTRQRDLKDRKEKLNRQIAKLKKRGGKSSMFKAHQKARQVTAIGHKLERLAEQNKRSVPRLCFGSRKLFQAQFNLEANGYSTHEEWLEDWQSDRSSQFFLVGSKDETAGCVSCQATVNEDSTITLKLRMAPALEAQFGKHVTIDGVYFAYGHHEVLLALHRGTALTYRFHRDSKGWRVFVACDRVTSIEIEDFTHGAVGVDFNSDHLAVTVVDHDGNPTETFSIPAVTYGTTSDQARAILGDACKQVVDIAVSRRLPIAMELIDFADKKKSLRDLSPRRARMLSGLAYSAYGQTLKSRAGRFGVKVYEVNPAYTSLIGRAKFADRYGYTVHQSAASVIARRAMRLSERLPSPAILPDGRGSHVTLDRPARIGRRHVWASWRKVAQGYNAALAARYRANRKVRPTPARLSPAEVRQLEDDAKFLRSL